MPMKALPATEERCEYILKSGNRCKFRHADGQHCRKHSEKHILVKLIASRFDEDPADVDLEQMCDSPTSRAIVQSCFDQISTSKTLLDVLT